MTLQIPAAPDRAPTPKSPGEWQALHIFYAANPRPLLLQCVRPLVADLTAKGLLDGYFFINYWLEGPHVRLRLRPATAAATNKVRRQAEFAVGEFLRARPALYDVEASGFRAEMYNTLFGLEIREDKQARFLGPDGRMRVRQNNTCSFEPYEPEYGKYGGPAGVELAEWHFRHSSDLVIKAIGSLNLHLRTVALGTAAQLMLVMASSFLGDRPAVTEFLDQYHHFWHKAFAGTDFIGTDEYARGYEGLPADVGQRFDAVLDAIWSGETDHLAGFMRDWSTHCLELAGKAADLAVRGHLVFRHWDDSRDEHLTDPDVALRRLLFPYMHMTNNRLHMTIRDEAYLSYILSRALHESGAGGSLDGSETLP